MDAAFTLWNHEGMDGQTVTCTACCTPTVGSVCRKRSRTLFLHNKLQLQFRREPRFSPSGRARRCRSDTQSPLAVRRRRDISTGLIYVLVRERLSATCARCKEPALRITTSPSADVRKDTSVVVKLSEPLTFHGAVCNAAPSGECLGLCGAARTCVIPL